MIIEQNIQINTSPDVIFKQYQDVSHWNSWDKDVLDSDLEGNFCVGTSGTLEPIHGPKSRFILNQVSQDQSFTTETKLPLCRLIFEHQLTPNEKGTWVTHTVRFEGLLSPIFGKLIGNAIKKGLPNALIGLKSVCEAREHS